MDLLSVEINTILTILVPITLMLIFGIAKKNQKIIRLENHKLDVIYAELTSEKKLFIALQHSSEEIKKIENKTHYQLQKIKVDLLNIDFTLKEIL